MPLIANSGAITEGRQRRESPDESKKVTCPWKLRAGMRSKQR
jgi:hypothetical protein